MDEQEQYEEFPDRSIPWKFAFLFISLGNLK